MMHVRNISEGGGPLNSAGPFWNYHQQEEQMDKKEMKKILAGVGIAGLLSGVPMGGGVAFGGSG